MSSVMESQSALEAVLPGYEIGAELGRGAFGIVMAGRHRQLGREVAIKVLSQGLVDNADVRSRFLAEAQLLASIEHPHIVPVYDYVEHDDACALVMEHLSGGTVWGRFVDRGFDHRTACAIALVACSGLQGAHKRGVLHRDMKPENMLFGEDRVLKVTDFGIARVLGEDDTLATAGGDLLGTPAYMAPEQASGADLGPATDVYASGVMLYELLSGRLPFDEEGGSLAIVLRHMNEEPTPLRDVAPAVPPKLVEVVMQAIARSPSDRFDSAEGFGVAVGEAAAASWGATWLEGLRVSLREPGPILVSAQTAPATAVAAPGLDGGEVVKPSIEIHAGAGAGDDLVLSDLMPLRRTPVDMPAFPTALAWVGAALAVVALVLGLLGVGSSTTKPGLPAGSVTVAGHDPTAGRVPVNLNQPIPIVVHGLPAGSGVPSSARLVISLGGLSVVHSTSVPFVRTSDGLVTNVDASAGRYLVGGKLTANLELVGSQGTVDDHFGLHASRSPFGTFGGVVGIALLLIVAAYTESILRTLRRGRRRQNRAAVGGLAVVGAFGGLAAALFGWMIGISAPTIGGIILPAVIAAAAGLVGGLAARRVGERARVKRRSNRLVLVAKRKSVSAPQPASAGGEA